MSPIEFEGSRMIGKPNDMADEECFAMPIYQSVDSAGYPFFLECWKPNYKDMQAIARGEPIWIKVIALGLPPISVFTMDVEGNINEE